MDIDPQKLKLAAAGGAVTVGLVAGFLVFGGSADDGKLTAADRGDAGLAFESAQRHTDLLSPPVAPGAEVATGVTLPAGAHLAGALVLTGDSVGRFEVEAVTEKPTEDGAGVWLEVRAKNASAASARLTALAGYSSP